MDNTIIFTFKWIISCTSLAFGLNIIKWISFFSLITSDFCPHRASFIAAGNVLIGKEEVEMDSVGEEVSLWHKMMQYPDSWAEGTLPLRSTMEKTKGK